MKTSIFSLSALSLLILLWTGCASPAPEAEKEQVVNLYSHRHYESDQKLYDTFTQQTGIKVNVVEASADEVITRLEAEGANSPADLIITADVGRLTRAKDLGLLQAFASAVADEIINPNLSDPDKMWYPITVRARVIAYSKERVKPETITSYEDLADPLWAKKVLARSSSNVYNQSLLASVVAHLGEGDAEKWVQGMVANFAREPKGNDRDQVKDIAAGVGDLALVNTYYMGLLANSEDPAERAAFEKVGIIFPNQQDRGTHINVSGVGLTKHAPNKENATKLLEFLLSPASQTALVQENYEYPVNSTVTDLGPFLMGLGEFVRDEYPLYKFGSYMDTATDISNRAGWK